MAGKSSDELGNGSGGGPFQTPGDMGNSVADQERVELRSALDAGLGDELLEPFVAGSAPADEVDALQQALEAIPVGATERGLDEPVSSTDVSYVTVFITDPGIENTYLVMLNCEGKSVGLLIHSEGALCDLIEAASNIQGDDEFLQFLRGKISITKLEAGKLSEKVGIRSYSILVQMVLVEIARRQLTVRMSDLETSLEGLLLGQDYGLKLDIVRVINFSPKLMPVDYDSCKDGFLKEMGFVREVPEDAGSATLSDSELE